MFGSFLHTKTKPLTGTAPKLIGTLAAIGVTPWVPVELIPNGFFAQLQGTSGTCTATAKFEYSMDGVNLAATDPTALSFSATGTGAGNVVQALAPTTFNPWVPFGFVRLNCSAITGTGTQLQAFQMIGN